MSEIRVPVLVVGGGGAGLCASIFLSSHGVEHLLVERHDSTSNLPKAHYLNQRTMEFFRQHAVADPVYAAGTPIEHAEWVTWQTTLGGDGPPDAKILYKMDCFGGGQLKEVYSKDSACPPSNLPQLRLEPILRAEAERRAPGAIRFSHELATMTQDSEGVTATIHNKQTGQTYTVRADYLVAADGGKTVGAMVGVNMVGARNLFDMVSTHKTADFSQ
jgi:2,4-dichlorophenol 6-monooxygenase